MKQKLQEEDFDAKICPSDWRYSAAIVGMLRYFEFFEPPIPYKIQADEQGTEWLYYRMDNISGEKAEQQYLQFAESFFSEYMHHKVIERLLKENLLSEEQEKLLKEKMSANTICKKCFGKIKYSQETKKEIQNVIDNNRNTLIKETYALASTMCKKFIYSKNGKTKLFTSAGDVCRLNGYYVDLPKKSKSISYYWDYGTYVANDEPEFDFIPFAFTKSREGFFINNNFNIKNLKKSNDLLSESMQRGDEKIKNPRAYAFRGVKESSCFLDYEVEVICKSQDKETFETLFIRKSAINIFKNISDYMFQAIEKPCKIGNDYYSMLETITNRIINLMHLDDVIEKVFKENQDGGKIYLIHQMIIINQLIYNELYDYGGKDMQKKTNWARATANDVTKKLIAMGAKNKINSYQQKLISAITFKDYDRFCEILLQLSSYVEVPFDFAYDLFDDFDHNKNMAYAFVEGLQGRNNQDKQLDEKGRE